MIKSKKFRLCMMLFVCMTYLIGCATIVSGTTQNITVSSKPQGAEIVVEPGGERSITPGEIELKRDGGPYRITVNLEGYKPYTVVLTTSTNGWVWGNLLLGGIIGIIVDSSTGAHNELSPEDISANLIKEKIDIQSLSNDQLYFFSSDNKLLGELRIK